MSFVLTDEDSNQYTLEKADFVGGLRAGVRGKLLELAFSHGARDIGDSKVSSRIIRIKTAIDRSTSAAFQSARDSFFQAIAKPNQTFAYKSGRYINVDWITMRSDAIIMDLKSVSEIELHCGDPFFYSDSLTTESTWTVTSSPDTNTVTNSGNVDVFPVIEITASADLGTGIELKNQTDDNALFTYADTSFTAGTKLTIDCVQGTVDFDGTNTIRFFEGQFLRLLAGSNTLEYTGGNCSIVVKHRDRWL